jgi:hypothetical protein
MDDDELIAIVLCHLWVMFYVAYPTHQISPCKFRAIKRNVFLVLLLSVYTIHIQILMMPRRKLTPREEVSLDITIFSRCSSFSGTVIVFSIEYYFTGWLVYYLYKKMSTINIARCLNIFVELITPCRLKGIFGKIVFCPLAVFYEQNIQSFRF